MSLWAIGNYLLLYKVRWIDILRERERQTDRKKDCDIIFMYCMQKSRSIFYIKKDKKDCVQKNKTVNKMWTVKVSSRQILYTSE